MNFHNIDKEYILSTAKSLMEFHSPSGFCHEIIEEMKSWVKELGYEMTVNQKGCGFISIAGKSKDRVIGLSSHVDTLGAMVRSITSDGQLKFTLVGGPIVPTLDGEYCQIKTRDGKLYTGTFLSTSPAVHVFKDASSKPRDTENMAIRIDECVKSKEDVENLGIMPGDFIFIEPKTTITPSGFIKSRFIDDKGSVACLFGLMKYLKDNNLTPEYDLRIVFSVYEEVGHGSSNIPEDITELIAVDMGCIGEDLSCTEYDVSICAKDSGGPYDYNMTTTLINLAKENKLSYAVDIYPFYGSDVRAALTAGYNIKGALIGPGVHASHGMERTHYFAFENTLKLLISYITLK